MAALKGPCGPRVVSQFAIFTVRANERKSVDTVLYFDMSAAVSLQRCHPSGQ